MSLRAYFLFPDGEVGGVPDALACGLDALGAEILVNQEVRFLDPPERLRHPAVAEIAAAADCDLVIADLSNRCAWPAHAHDLAEALLDLVPPGRLALTLGADATTTMIGVPDGVPILCLHEIEAVRARGWRIPWTVGLMRAAAVAAAAPLPAWETREATVLRCFRPAIYQDVRDALDLMLLPTLEQHLTIDRRIHGIGLQAPSYLARLREVQICLGYCGWIAPLSIIAPSDLPPGTPRSAWDGDLICDPSGMPGGVAVLRWDSFRFWEAMAAGCLTINLDLDWIGARMPVRPVNWEHYVGLRFDRITEDVERLMDERARWPAIAQAGREFVLAHYTPQAMAQRLLDLLPGFSAGPPSAPPPK